MRFINPNCYIGIIWCHGQEWIDVRRFTKKILKEFGYGKIKTMDQSLAESANQLVDGIKMELMDSPDRIFTVLSRKFSIHVVNVLWNMVGGYKFDPSDERLKRNIDCVEKLEEITGHSNQYNMFPFLKTWFPSHVRYPEHLKIHQEIHDFTKVICYLKCHEHPDSFENIYRFLSMTLRKGGVSDSILNKHLLLKYFLTKLKSIMEIQTQFTHVIYFTTKKNMTSSERIEKAKTFFPYIKNCLQ